MYAFLYIFHRLQPAKAFGTEKNELAWTFGSKNRTSRIACVLTFLLNCVECSSICQYNYSIKTKEMEECDIWTLGVITVCMNRRKALTVVYRMRIPSVHRLQFWDTLAEAALRFSFWHDHNSPELLVREAGTGQICFLILSSIICWAVIGWLPLAMFSPAVIEFSMWKKVLLLPGFSLPGSKRFLFDLEQEANPTKSVSMSIFVFVLLFLNSITFSSMTPMKHFTNKISWKLNLWRETFTFDKN